MAVAADETFSAIGEQSDDVSDDALLDALVSDLDWLEGTGDGHDDVAAADEPAWELTEAAS